MVITQEKLYHLEMKDHKTKTSSFLKFLQTLRQGNASLQSSFPYLSTKLPVLFVWCPNPYLRMFPIVKQHLDHRTILMATDMQFYLFKDNLMQA